MKLKHIIRDLIINVLSESISSDLTHKDVRKLIECDLKEQLPDRKERKAAIEDAIVRLVKKAIVLETDTKLKLAASSTASHIDPTLKRKGDSVTSAVGNGDVHHSKKQCSRPTPPDESKHEPLTNTVSGVVDLAVPTAYPPYQKPTGNNTILLFYAYCYPSMTRVEQDEAIAFCYSVLTKNKISGRLRVGKEGFNSTLTGPHDGVREFTKALRVKFPETFGHTDFKYVDDQPDSQLLKGLKVWPVTEIVTYGFNPEEAPLDMRGTHLKPDEFHSALENPNSVVIDVRNFNETLIGKFAPPLPPGVTDISEKVLDPCMRRSTEFPQWLEDNRHKLDGKQVLMYCTAGVRCERASAYMRYHGIQNVFQLEGGIHRYLDAYPEDGGHWIGKNYVFDKRFAHGAKVCEVISSCVACEKPWERYQAQLKCFKCAMEVLVCKDCQRIKPAVPKNTLFCPLCKSK